MGQKDISLVRFFDDQRRYADLINGFVFKGQQVVSEEDVQDMDSRVTGVIGKFRNRMMVQKYRDAVRKVIFGMGIAIIGIENQDLVHHGMPVRMMLEDAAEYDKQMRQIKRRHRFLRDLRGHEFLGGIAGYDKVHPVITICIYYGKTPYHGAKELFQMMDYEVLPQKLKELMNNYKIQLLELREFQDIDCFQSDLREVFGMIQRSGDKDATQSFTEENEEKLQALDEEAFDVIVSVTGSQELEQVKDKYRCEGGKINMCEAIRGMIEDGRLAGIAQGIEQGMAQGVEQGIEQGIKVLVEVCQDFGVSREITKSKIMQKYCVDQKRAEDFLKEYWK